MKKNILILVFAFLSVKPALWAQAKDSVAAPVDSVQLSNDIMAKAKSDSIARARLLKKKIYAAPRRATVMSAILPGLGQAYNKKYWKIPLIYAGLGGLGYMFITNNREYTFYRKNLIAENDNDSTTVNTTPYSSDQLETQKLYYKKYRDFAIIGIGLIYLINIIDANVDGHLKTFDVSDDLSIHIDPWQSIYRTAQSGYRTATGLSIKINFH